MLFRRHYQLRREQLVNASLEDCWAFFCNPLNLEKITPPWLSFNPLNREFDRMYPGMILRYTVTPMLGIKVRWMTEITHVEPLKYFVDEQRFGPYMLWHHQHHFEPRGDKTFMVDEVNYVMPMYFIGTIMHAVMVRRQLNEIFDYRKKMIDQIFPAYRSLASTNQIPVIQRT